MSFTNASSADMEALFDYIKTQQWANAEIQANYIRGKDSLESLASSYPNEYLAAKNGSSVTIRPNVGGQTIPFVLGRYKSGETYVCEEGPVLMAPASATVSEVPHPGAVSPLGEGEWANYVGSAGSWQGAVRFESRGSSTLSLEPGKLVELGEMDGATYSQMVGYNVYGNIPPDTTLTGKFLRLRGSVSITPGRFSVYRDLSPSGNGTGFQIEQFATFPGYFYIGILKRGSEDLVRPMAFGAGGYDPTLDYHAYFSTTPIQEVPTFTYDAAGKTPLDPPVENFTYYIPDVDCYDNFGPYYAMSLIYSQSWWSTSTYIADSKPVPGHSPQQSMVYTTGSGFGSVVNPKSYPYFQDIVLNIVDGSGNYPAITTEKSGYRQWEQIETPLYAASVVGASLQDESQPDDPDAESPIPAPMPDRKPPDPNSPDPNGQPPTVKPMPRPITSSCKSTMDGPASCNFVVDPLPGDDFPKPGDVVAPDFSTPDFSTPDFAPMPVIDVNFPEMPPIGCNLPDFTNMSDCPPVPGTGGPLPGGRDRRGKRGINPNIKTGGKTHGKRRKVFPGPKHSGPHKRCFPAGASCMGAITELLMGVGISPLDIVFQIGPEWDKQLRREKCFRRGVSRLDAAAWFASKLMCRIIDEGPPTHNVYIGPPHHRPGQKTWTFDEHFDLFAVSHSSTSEGSYHAVEIFGDHFREPYPISLVENPFASPDESEILQIEVGPDYTRREAERLAAFRAAALRRASVSVQASVPYSEEYMMRDRMILRAPDRGFQETYLIYGKQSDLSPEGRIHILTGVLPATAREMEQFPKVT